MIKLRMRPRSGERGRTFTPQPGADEGRNDLPGYQRPAGRPLTRTDNRRGQGTTLAAATRRGEHHHTRVAPSRYHPPPNCPDISDKAASGETTMTGMTRREAAQAAARARIAAMTPEQRRQMTAAARAALRAADLAAVDEEAHRRGWHLTEDQRQRLADVRGADRARAAGRASQEAAHRRRALAEALRQRAEQRRDHRDGRRDAALGGRGADPALMQMAARR